MSFQTWLVLGMDALAGAFLGGSVSLFFRSRNIYREALSEARRVRSDCTAGLIETLDKAAAQICPLCAKLAGVKNVPFLGLTVGIEGQNVEIDHLTEESEGVHQVEAAGRSIELPCFAGPIRQLTRNLFAQEMNRENPHESYSGGSE